MVLSDSVEKILCHKHLPLVAALIAMGLATPSLRSGLQGDDLWFRCAIERPPGLERVFDERGSCSLVADGHRQRTEYMVSLGLLPWWCPQDFKLWFWRPVSNVTHALDFVLWPAIPALMHLQSILWYGVWTFCVALLYRRVVPGIWVAGLAGLLFAVDDAHALPACWIASRNTVIAGVFAVVCLLLHDVWRKQKAWPWPILSSVAFGLALLSKESAIAVCAYLFAYALFLDRGRTGSRVWSLMPYGLIVVVWQTVYRILGFGVSDSAHYIDPAGAPLHALKAVFERGPLLLFGQWGFPPAETVWLLSPMGRQVFWLVAIVWLMLLFYFLIPLLRTERMARFCFVGMLLATVPACMGMVMGRMLEFVGIGGMGLLAMLLGVLPGQCRRSVRPFSRWSCRITLWVLLTFHLIFAPIGFLIAHWELSRALGKRAEVLTQAAAMPDLAAKTVIFPNPPHASYASYLQIRRALAGQPLPAHAWALAPGGLPHGHKAIRFKRLDPYRLEVETTEGIPVQLERGRRHPLRVGDRIDLDGMTVTISEVDSANLPTTMVFAFSVPLESPSIVWLETTRKAVSPWSPPGIGETFVLGDAAGE